jgi:hypothetical protein
MKISKIKKKELDKHADKVRHIQVKKDQEYATAENLVDILMYEGLIEYADDVGINLIVKRPFYVAWKED